jgi:hypothetical protein
MTLPVKFDGISPERIVESAKEQGHFDSPFAARLYAEELVRSILDLQRTEIETRRLLAPKSRQKHIQTVKQLRILYGISVDRRGSTRKKRV